jgi:1-acyl-sn-glycerol-3-phosphate acyltransferase
MGKLETQGLDNIPREGPFLLIANHQSVLDPMLVQSLCPRPMHTMAKSTQFTVPVIGRIMSHCYGYPVRRFEVDPQAVRITLRRLRQGHPVSIYIEGERSWDGRLQKPRPGTVRLALKAGVPIIPAAIAGAYDVWPRWDRAVRSGAICVRYGPVFRLPQLDRRADREAILPETSERIMSAIRAELVEADRWVRDARGW